ncbi:hypothetical protein [Mucilaginibacter phyllosphaerae]
MENLITVNDHKRNWWRKRRLQYNNFLATAGIVAFFCYAILGSLLIAPYVNDFEITLFTIMFQGIGYLIMMGVANIFYNLGYWIDKKYNNKNSETFRSNLYKLGCWFSCSLPFLIPIIIIIEYFVMYSDKQPLQPTALYEHFNILLLLHGAI